jgi:hypothetical protein
MPPLRQTISFGATPRPEQPQGANRERTDLSRAAILLCYVSEAGVEGATPVKASDNAVLKATTRLESPEGTKPLSGVTNAMADDFRGWFAVAGPELTPNQFHCAIVGAREAVVGVADVNAAHWKAAKEGKQGYRLPKTDPVIPGMGYDWQPAQSEPESGSKRAIPDDLSIPDFLLRQPPQHFAVAA